MSQTFMNYSKLHSEIQIYEIILERLTDEGAFFFHQLYQMEFV
jgi:hypothetical protein